MKRKDESMVTQQGKKKLKFKSKSFEEDSEDDFLPLVPLYLLMDKKSHHLQFKLSIPKKSTYFLRISVNRKGRRSNVVTKLLNFII